MKRTTLSPLSPEVQKASKKVIKEMTKALNRFVPQFTLHENFLVFSSSMTLVIANAMLAHKIDKVDDFMHDLSVLVKKVYLHEKQARGKN
jgi:hypothetical protein